MFLFCEFVFRRRALVIVQSGGTALERTGLACHSCKLNYIGSILQIHLTVMQLPPSWTAVEILFFIRGRQREESLFADALVALLANAGKIICLDDYLKGLRKRGEYFSSQIVCYLYL